ncbi:MAG: dihydrodipicolinate synthase family protein [Clostridia bacterium]|nr:dihydrodipicolinate synthase family protein [Clostridia bacterium]
MGLMQGVSAPQLTPIRPDGSVDYDRYSLLSDRLARGGIQGIFVCGTTGEFANMTAEERRQLLPAARNGAGKAVRLMYNVTALNLQDIRMYIEWAKKQGADCLSVTPPYYHSYDAQTLIGYFRAAAEIAEGMPVYLYNIPGMAKNPITPPILRAVLEKCGNVCGLKDSSMDFQTFLEFRLAAQDKPDFELITGNDAQVLAALQYGGAGGVIALAGVFPELCESVYSLWQAGKIREARDAQDTVLKLRSLVRRIMPVMAHKEILRLLGFDMGPARFPFRELNEGEKAEIKNTLVQLGLL